MIGLSAGGSLALSLLAKLKQDGINLPAGVVLKSPFTDVSITSSVFKSWSQYPVESEAGIFLQFAGVKACFGMADLESPLVSPIHANMMGFPPMLIQVGTKDIAYDQGRELAKKAEQAGVNVTLEQYQDMIHGFHYMDLPERAEAFKNIAMFVHETLD